MKMLLIYKNKEGQSAATVTSITNELLIYWKKKCLF
jgi:hypothetical protein